MTRRMPKGWAPRAGGERPSWYRVGPVQALAAPDKGAGSDGGSESSTADVYLFDVIGGWMGATAEDFVTDVASLDVDQIVLHLNSPGGDASEGVAIANVLRAHKARVVVRVDGMAASAASVVAMAGDEVVMGIGSQLMIHDAWALAIGDASDMAAAQRMLDSTSNAIASTYAAKAGGTVEEWREVMRAESWYGPEEAVAAGLADRVAAADEVGTAEGEQVTPGASSWGGFWDMWDSLRDPDRFDLAAFAHAGRGNAPAPVMPGRQTPAARAAGDGSNLEGGRPVAFSDEQLTTMRQRLGVADDADEQTILDALGEALDERADDVPEPVAARLPEGVVAIDRDQLAELRARAERGDQARAQQEQEHREGLVDAAVRDGRIPVARRDAWLAQLQADPGAAETLASLQAGLVPVAAIGYSSGEEPSETGEQRVKNGAGEYARRHGKTA